jgi:hypothetical protein
MLSSPALSEIEPLQQKKIEIYDKPSNLGGSFTVSIEKGNFLPAVNDRASGARHRRAPSSSLTALASCFNEMLAQSSPQAATGRPPVWR